MCLSLRGAQNCSEALEGVTVSKFLRSYNTMDIEQRGVRVLNRRAHIHPHLCLKYTLEGLRLHVLRISLLEAYGNWKERTLDAVKSMSQNTERSYKE
jgi:hypothetical protein